MIIDEFNVIKFEDLLITLQENAKKLTGLNVYAFNVYAAGTKVGIRAYSPNMRGKELVGLDVVKDEMEDASNA